MYASKAVRVSASNGGQTVTLPYSEDRHETLFNMAQDGGSFDASLLDAQIGTEGVVVACGTLNGAPWRVELTARLHDDGMLCDLDGNR